MALQVPILIAIAFHAEFGMCPTTDAPESTGSAEIQTQPTTSTETQTLGEIIIDQDSADKVCHECACDGDANFILCRFRADIHCIKFYQCTQNPGGCKASTAQVMACVPGRVYGNIEKIACVHPGSEHDNCTGKVLSRQSVSAEGILMPSYTTLVFPLAANLWMSRPSPCHWLLKDLLAICSTGLLTLLGALDFITWW